LGSGAYKLLIVVLVEFVLLGSGTGGVGLISGGICLVKFVMPAKLIYFLYFFSKFGKLYKKTGDSSIKVYLRSNWIEVKFLLWVSEMFR